MLGSDKEIVRSISDPIFPKKIKINYTSIKVVIKVNSYHSLLLKLSQWMVFSYFGHTFLYCLQQTFKSNFGMGIRPCFRHPLNGGNDLIW